MYNNCIICGNPGMDVNMIGEYKTCLCDNHRNEFHEFYLNTEIVKEKRRLDIAAKFIENITHRDLTDEEKRGFEQLNTAWYELEEKCYYMSKKWIEDNVQK